MLIIAITVMTYNLVVLSLIILITNKLMIIIVIMVHN